MRQSIRAFINSAAGNVLFSPLVPQPIKSSGLRFYAERPRVEMHQMLQIKFGHYETYEKILVRRHFRRDLDAIDLGASLGVVSCEILKTLVERKLVAVEADPDLADITRRNISLNFQNADAEVITGAVVAGKDFQESVSFARPLSGNLGGAILGSYERHSEVISVPALLFSDIVQKFGGSAYQLACDIEGAEIPLLIHEAAMFEGCQIMMIELHRAFYDGRLYVPDEVEDLVLRLGMRKQCQVGPVYLFVRG